MRVLVWLTVAVGAALWLLISWAAYVFVGWFGDLAAANAGWLADYPEAIAWLSWSAGWLTDLGQAGVVAASVLGFAFILTIPLLVGLARRLFFEERKTPG